MDQTNSGNINGWVDTTNATETITAYGTITPTGPDPNQATADFDQWVNLVNPQNPPISGADFTAMQEDDYYAFAFYKAPPAPPPLDRCHSLAQDVRTLIDQLGAPGIPPSLKPILQRELMGCKGELGSAEVNSLIAALNATEPPPRRIP